MFEVWAHSPVSNHIVKHRFESWPAAFSFWLQRTAAYPNLFFTLELT
jgi:hypothetical protein